MTHLELRKQKQLVKDVVVLTHEENAEVCSVPRGQPSSSEIKISQPEVKHTLHWTAKGKEHHLLHVCRMKKCTLQEV
jgi:hypothetical protein